MRAPKYSFHGFLKPRLAKIPSLTTRLAIVFLLIGFVLQLYQYSPVSQYLAVCFSRRANQLLPTSHLGICTLDKNMISPADSKLKWSVTMRLEAFVFLFNLNEQEGENYYDFSLIKNGYCRKP